MKKKMWLWVWHDVFSDYTSGIAFAIAPTKIEAVLAVINSRLAKMKEPAIKKLPLNADPTLNGWIQELTSGYNPCSKHSVSKVYGDFESGGG